MAKTNKSNPISLELDRFEKKIKQYQDYLDRNNLLNIEDAGERHKEISAQNSIMDKLPNWLEGLKRLRDDSEKSQVQMRGDSTVNKAYEILKGKDNE